jgi:Zn-dependent protease
MQSKRGVRIGRPFGIPLVVHGSWFPAALLLVLHFAVTAYSRLPHVQAYFLAIASALLFFSSLVAHELAHALVARRLGIPVIDITLFVFGGVARIAREPSRPSDEIKLAAAGPMLSAALGTVALVLAGGGGAGRMVFTLGLANLTLAGFNLFPGYPLDGGRILHAIVWARSGDPHRAAILAAGIGQSIGAALAAAGCLVWAITGTAVSGISLVIVGGFLFSLAGATRRAALVSRSLGGQEAALWARPFEATLAMDDALSSVTGAGPWAVSRNGRLAGLVLAGERNASSAREAMIPWTSRLAYPARAPLQQALERLAIEDCGVLVVVDDDGSVVGVLDHAGVRARLDGAARTDLDEAAASR